MLTAKPKPFAASLVCGFCVSKNHFRHEVRVCRLHGAHPEKAERCVVLRKRKDHETTGWEWWRLAGYAGAGGTSLTSLGRAAAKQPNTALAADRQTAQSGSAAGVSAATPPAGTLAGDERGGPGHGDSFVVWVHAWAPSSPAPASNRPPLLSPSAPRRSPVQHGHADSFPVEPDGC